MAAGGCRLCPRAGAQRDPGERGQADWALLRAGEPEPGEGSWGRGTPGRCREAAFLHAWFCRTERSPSVGATGQPRSWRGDRGGAEGRQPGVPAPPRPEPRRHSPRCRSSGHTAPSSRQQPQPMVRTPPPTPPSAPRPAAPAPEPPRRSPRPTAEQREAPAPRGVEPVPPSRGAQGPAGAEPAPPGTAGALRPTGFAPQSSRGAEGREGAGAPAPHLGLQPRAPPGQSSPPWHNRRNPPLFFFFFLQKLFIELFLMLFPKKNYFFFQNLDKKKNPGVKSKLLTAEPWTCSDAQENRWPLAAGAACPEGPQTPPQVTPVGCRYSTPAQTCPQPLGWAGHPMGAQIWSQGCSVSILPAMHPLGRRYWGPWPGHGYQFLVSKEHVCPATPWPRAWPAPLPSLLMAADSRLKG